VAHAFARLPSLDGAPRTLAAMRRHADLVRGPRAADSALMREAPGWTAKGGAEGLLAAVSRDGVGVALKVEDGATRAVAPALAEVVRRLEGLPAIDCLALTPVENSRGEQVGEVRLAP
jgi:L-asparaginase II